MPCGEPMTGSLRRETNNNLKPLGVLGNSTAKAHPGRCRTRDHSKQSSTAASRFKAVQAPTSRRHQLLLPCPGSLAAAHATQLSQLPSNSFNTTAPVTSFELLSSTCLHATCNHIVNNCAPSQLHPGVSFTPPAAPLPGLADSCSYSFPALLVGVSAQLLPSQGMQPQLHTLVACKPRFFSTTCCNHTSLLAALQCTTPAACAFKASQV